MSHQQQQQRPLEIPETRTFDQVRDALIRLYHSPANALLAPSSSTAVERADPLLDSDALLPFIVRPVDEAALRGVIVERQNVAGTGAAARKTVGFAADKPPVGSSAIAAQEALAQQERDKKSGVAAGPVTGKTTLSHWCNALFPPKAQIDREREAAARGAAFRKKSHAQDELSSGGNDTTVFHYSNDPSSSPSLRRFDAYVEAGPSCGKTTFAQQICREQPFEGAVAVYLPLHRIVYGRKEIGSLRHLLQLALGGVVTNNPTAGMGMGGDDDDDDFVDAGDDAGDSPQANYFGVEMGNRDDNVINHRIDSVAEFTETFHVESRFDPAMNLVVSCLIDELSRPMHDVDDDDDNDGESEAMSIVARLSASPPSTHKNNNDDDDAAEKARKKTNPIPIVWVVDDLDAVDRSTASRVLNFLQDFVAPSGRNAEFQGVLGSLYSTSVRRLDSILCFSRDDRRREVCNFEDVTASFRAKRFILERWNHEKTQEALYAQLSLKMSTVFSEATIDFGQIKQLAGSVNMSPEVFFGNNGPFRGSPYMVDIFAETVCMIAAPNVSTSSGNNNSSSSSVPPPPSSSSSGFACPSVAALAKELHQFSSPLILFKKFLALRWARFLKRSGSNSSSSSSNNSKGKKQQPPPPFQVVMAMAAKLADHMLSRLHCNERSDSLLSFSLEHNEDDDDGAQQPQSPSRSSSSNSKKSSDFFLVGTDPAWAEAMVQCGLLHKFQRRRETVNVDVAALRKMQKEQNNKSAAAQRIMEATSQVKQLEKQQKQDDDDDLAVEIDADADDDYSVEIDADDDDVAMTAHSPSRFLKSDDIETHTMFTSSNLERINIFAQRLHQQQQQSRSSSPSPSSSPGVPNNNSNNKSSAEPQLLTIYSFRHRLEMELFAALRYVGTGTEDQPPAHIFKQSIAACLPWHPTHRVVWLALASHCFHLERDRATGGHSDASSATAAYKDWPYTSALCATAAAKFFESYKAHRAKFSDAQIHSLDAAQLDAHQDGVYCSLIVEMTKILDPRYLLQQVEDAHGWHRKLPSHFFWMVDQCGRYGLHLTLRDLLRRIEANGERKDVPIELWSRCVRNLQMAPLAATSLPPVMEVIRTAVSRTHEIKEMSHVAAEISLSEKSAKKNMASVLPNRALPPEQRRKEEGVAAGATAAGAGAAGAAASLGGGGAGGVSAQQQRLPHVAAPAGAAVAGVGAGAGLAAAAAQSKQQQQQNQQQAHAAERLVKSKKETGAIIISKATLVAIDALTLQETTARATLEHICLATAATQRAVGSFYFRTWVVESNVSRDLWNVGPAHKSGGNDVWFSTFAPLRRVVSEDSVMESLGLDESWAAQPVTSSTTTTTTSSSSSSSSVLSAADFAERLSRLETGLCYANTNDALFVRGQEENGNKIRCRLALIEGPPHVGKSCFAQQLCVCQPCFGRVAIYIPFASVLQRHPQILDSIDKFIQTMVNILARLPFKIDFAVPFVWVLDDLDCVDRRNDRRLARLLSHFADAARTSSLMTARASTDLDVASPTGGFGRGSATPRSSDNNNSNAFAPSASLSNVPSSSTFAQKNASAFQHSTASARPHDLCIVVSRDLRENGGCFLIDTGANGPAEFQIERWYLPPWGPLLTHKLAFETWRRLCVPEALPFADFFSVVQRVCALPAMEHMCQRPKLLSMVCRLVATGQLSTKTREQYLNKMTPLSVFMMDLAERASGGRVPPADLQTLIANVAPIAIRSVNSGFPWRMTAGETIDSSSSSIAPDNASFASAASSTTSSLMPTPRVAQNSNNSNNTKISSRASVASTGSNNNNNLQSHFIGAKKKDPAVAGGGGLSNNNNNLALNEEMESPDWVAHMVILGLVRQELFASNSSSRSRVKTQAGTPFLYTARGGSAAATPMDGFGGNNNGGYSTPVDRYLEQEATHDVFINFSRRHDADYLAALGLLEHAAGYAAAKKEQAEEDAASKIKKAGAPSAAAAAAAVDDDDDIEIEIGEDDDDDDEIEIEIEEEDEKPVPPPKQQQQQQQQKSKDDKSSPLLASSPQPGYGSSSSPSRTATRRPTMALASTPKAAPRQAAASSDPSSPPAIPPAAAPLTHTPPELSINLRQAWLLAAHSATDKSALHELANEAAARAAKSRNPITAMFSTVLSLEMTSAVPGLIDEVILPSCESSPAMRTTMVLMSGVFGAQEALQTLLVAGAKEPRKMGIPLSALCQCFVRVALHGECVVQSSGVLDLLAAYSRQMFRVSLPVATRLGSVPVTRWLIRQKREKIGPSGSDGEIALSKKIARAAGDESVLFALEPIFAENKN